MVKFRVFLVVASLVGLIILVLMTTFSTKKVFADRLPQKLSGRVIRMPDKNADGLIQYNNKNKIEGAINLIYKDGFFGVGEPYPANNLDVAGSMAIGVDYTSSVAPDNGLKIQGHTIIGSPVENATGATLQVAGAASFSKNIILGSSVAPSGITIYDKVSKKAYCLEILNGSVMSVLGECSTI